MLDPQAYLDYIVRGGQLPVETQEGRGTVDPATGEVLSIDEEDILERLGPRSEAQDFIGTQLAGDVVPMRQPVPVYGGSDVVKRQLQSPGYWRGSQGQRSIEEFGGRKNPYLDLMDIIMYPQGGKVY